MTTEAEMSDEELSGTVIPATRGPIAERADGTLKCMLIIQPVDKASFLKLLPDIDLPVFITRQSPSTARELLQSQSIRQAHSPGEYGHYARALRTHIHWMGNPEVWAAVGSDSQYLDWCRNQPCAHCGLEPHWEMDRWVRSEPAHVRRVASGAGEAIKPPYSAIPLCHKDHAEQHQKGESAIGGKERCDKLRMQYLHDWIWERMRHLFDVESMSEVEPGQLKEWAEDNGLVKFLPRCYVTGVL
jgi:hypothetical protein